MTRQEKLDKIMGHFTKGLISTLSETDYSKEQWEQERVDLFASLGLPPNAKATDVHDDPEDQSSPEDRCPNCGPDLGKARATVVAVVKDFSEGGSAKVPVERINEAIKAIGLLVDHDDVLGFDDIMDNVKPAGRLFVIGFALLGLRDYGRGYGNKPF